MKTSCTPIATPIRRGLLFATLALSLHLTLAQSFTLLTWNIQHLGGSKDETELAAMVKVMRAYDLVLIQEVVAKDPAGAQAVAQLADLLNRTGSRWDYRISDPTQSPSSQMSERYAYLWKSSRLELIGDAYLDSKLADVCYREPYLARFRIAKSEVEFMVANYHSRKHDDQPEVEIAYFKDYPSRLGTQRVLIAGDFNLDENHAVWQPLVQRGFVPAVRRTPTTLKQKCTPDGHYFNYPIDNVYFHGGKFQALRSGRVDIVGDCANLEQARGVSDHVPVFVELEVR
ncbi:MAG: endonuclease/exonuclease/phosphatase family protein [Bacteroidia bacterium]